MISRSARLGRARLALAASIAVLVPLGMLAALLGILWFRAAVAVAAVIAAVIVAVVTFLELRAQHHEEEYTAGGRLQTAIGPIHSVDAHWIGVDQEQAAPLKEAARDKGHWRWEYVPRDCDKELREMLRAVKEGQPKAPTLVVVSGPSKAGKSRTLFEAARIELGNAQLIAPRTRPALVELMKPRMLPHLKAGPVVLWLDDLEIFVRLGEQGFDLQLLDRIERLGRPGLVLATYGGKGT